MTMPDGPGGDDLCVATALIEKKVSSLDNDNLPTKTRPPRYSDAVAVDNDDDETPVSLFSSMSQLVRMNAACYYGMWICGVVLAAVCVQDMYREYYPHTQFRDSSMCQDPVEREKAGIYAVLYCRRHTCVALPAYASHWVFMRSTHWLNSVVVPCAT
jgi:hypothetical protein